MAGAAQHKTGMGLGWCERALIGPVCATFGVGSLALLDARVSREGVAALVGAVDADLLHPGVAPLLPLGSLGFAEYYAMTSATLRECLSRVVRVFRVLAECIDLELIEDGTTASFVHRELARPRFSARLAETFFAVVFHRCATYVGPAFRALEVHFIHRQQEAHCGLEAVFGVPPRFESAADALVFPREALDCTLRTGDRVASGALEQTCADLERSAMTAPLAKRVTSAIEAALDAGDARLDAVAKVLGVSGRTLQRRLETDGSSFHHLLEEARRARALALIGGQDLPAKEVSRALGYSDTSVFFRAFRRWTGTSPAAYRARGRG